MLDTSFIENLLLTNGFKRFGFAKLETPLSMNIYDQWLKDGNQGDMKYLEDHRNLKANPKELLPQAKSAIVIAIDYLPHPELLDDFPLKSSRIAYYAKGKDYHLWIKEKLDILILELQKKYSTHVFRSFTDSAPILERDLAYRAGLGWIGKNTCLIDAKSGSLFFICEIYTSLEFSYANTFHPDRCGTCQRCLDICPTGALTKPKILDAKKCISYLTIESKINPPEDLREKISDWLFGCDLCQTVCPWNEKIFGSEIKKEEINFSKVELIKELQMILISSNKKLIKLFNKTALLRAGPIGLKRNAIIVATNLQLTDLLPLILTYQNSEKLKDLVLWSNAQFKKLMSHQVV